MEDKLNQSKGRAIPLVTYQNKKFVLDPEAEELLNNPNYKNIGIISLVGKYRTGKSFLLNRVLLNQKKLGFNVGPTIRPCTKGIWIWTEPVLVDNNNSSNKFSVFMIDTEGLGAYDEEINHDTKIFLIAVLISSLFIFNSFGTIDENSLNSLSFILNLSKTIKISNDPDTKNPNPNDLAKHFPSFFWLLRDFTLKLEDQEGNKITSKQYLENCLKFQKGESDKVEEKNKLRRLIMNYFPERDCHTLVRPLENESLLQQLMTLEDKEFRKEFIEQAEAFRTKVFNKVKPKSFFGKILSGEMIVQMLKSILDSINNGSVPVIENSWKYVCENECLKTFDNTIDHFKQQIRIFKEKNQDNAHFFSDFEALTRTLTRDCLETFKQQALGTEMMDYCDKLKYNINGEIKKFNDENSAFYEKKLKEILEVNIVKINENLDSDVYSKNNYEFFQDIENLKENTESSVPEFPSKKDIVFSNLITLIKKYIELIFIKPKQSYEREIISLKNENSNISNRYKVLNEELENSKLEGKMQNEKLNNIIMDLKVSENNNSEIIKNLEKDKRLLIEKTEREIGNVKRDSDIKVENYKNEMIKLKYEYKIKEDEIINLNFSIDKMTTLNSQKIEFLESEIMNYKNRYDQLKSENVNLIVENENLQGKIDDMKVDVNKKKILELEMNKMKSKERKFSESSTNFFGGGSGLKETIRGGSALKDNIHEENNNILVFSQEKESLSSLIMKTNLENTKQQLEETKKIYEDVISTLKENLGDLPQNLARILEKKKIKPSSNVVFNNNVKLIKPKNKVNKLKEGCMTLNESFDKTDEIAQDFTKIDKKIDNDENNLDSKSFSNNNITSPKYAKSELSSEYDLNLLREIVTSNTNLSNALASNEERCVKLEEKIKLLKEYKNIFKSSSLFQCKFCAKLLSSEVFTTHINLCKTNENCIEEKKDKFKMKVLKELVNKDENGKINHEFIIEIEKDNQSWKINRKLSHFVLLNKNLRTSYPTTQLPDSTKLFYNLNDNKLILLDKYLIGLTDLNDIKRSTILLNFCSLEHFKEQEYETTTETTNTNTTTNNNSVQPNSLKGYNNGNKLNNLMSSQVMPTRKKNDFTGFTKEIINTEESNKSINNPAVETKELTKKMKILNVSQKSFNTNINTRSQVKGSNKDKNSVSPLGNNNCTSRDLSGYVKNKVRQTNCSTPRKENESASTSSHLNNTGIIEEKNINDNATYIISQVKK